MTIIGDGPISLEFANFYSNLDSEVTIITNKSHLWVILMKHYLLKLKNI
ncbi:NAD-binding protein [Mycoplasmopsis felis]